MIFAFLMKVFSGMALIYLYTFYYTDQLNSDIYKYFSDGEVLFSSLKDHPLDYFKMMFGVNNDNVYFEENYYDKMRFWYSEYPTNIFSDSHTIIRFNAFVRLFSFGHIAVHNLAINLLSFLGLFKIYQFFKPLTLSNKFLFWGIILFPSLLFWGSGLLKEGLILFSLGLLFKNGYKLLQKFSFKQLAIVLFALAIIIYSKLYIIATLFPGMIGYLIYKKTKLPAPKAYSFSLVLIISICLLLLNAPLKFNPIELIKVKQVNFVELVDSVKNTSGTTLPPLQSTSDIILSIPNALLNTLIRPFIWECNSFFMLLSSFENIIILLCLALSITYRKQNLNWNSILFSLSFILFLYTLIGLTIPNFGAIARYKILAKPFIIIVITQLIEIDKIKGLIKKR